MAKSATADIVDAHVALVAARAGAVVITRDPDDLRTLAPCPATANHPNDHLTTRYHLRHNR